MKNLFAMPLLLASLLLGANSANASLIVLDFDDAGAGGIKTFPLSEDGFTFTVGSGHYDIVGDGGGGNAFNTDGFDSSGDLGFSTITLTKDDGGLFDVESFMVITPAPGNGFSITAVGNTGNIFAPGANGLFVFGDDFHGISALVTRQNSVGFFAYDDLTVRTPMPAPGTFLLLALGLLRLAYSRIFPATQRTPSTNRLVQGISVFCRLNQTVT